ncbi:hypothetical protein RMCBS344292_01504 [Rhizopus microsporus]|nr:hypothetical protein RMCBS344292_01504 [Rhizopus microsporus]
MSTNFKSTSIFITANFVCPTVADYEESVKTIIFTTSDKFEEWFKKDALSYSKCVFKRQYPVTSNLQFIGKLILEALPVHTIFYLCDHAGADKKKAKNSTGSSSNKLEAMRPMRSSIKIGCTAKIIEHVMTDGAIHVEYHWEYPDHCPWDAKEITNSRLPFEIK